MEITSLQIDCVTIPMEKPLGFATRSLSDRDYTIVRLGTDNGIEGLGVVGFGVSMHLREVIDRQLKHHIIGKDPLTYERIWENMYREIYRDRKGLPVVAISALDIAIWDIIGKYLKQPIHRLLGGYRNKVSCYASGGYYREGKGVKGLVNEIEARMDEGFSAFKIKVGRFSIKQDLERVKAVREVIGQDGILMIDANNAYDPMTAIKAGRLYEKYDPYWFEEPVWPDDIRGSAAVAEALDTPVASGELEYTRYGFRDIIQNRAADIIQPDASIMGGITEWLRVNAMAVSLGIGVSPHNAQEINSHLAGAKPNVLFVEFFVQGGDIRLEDKLFKDYLKPENGYLSLSDAPGLGIRLDEDAIARFASNP
jgi:D-arabinonate dehydratase